MEFANWMWLVLLVICMVVEALSVNLTTIWFAAGALVAFLLGLVGVPVGWQAAVFLVVSVVLVIFTRPIAVRYLKVGRTRTNVDSLIGQQGVVLQPMAEHQTGQVKVNGQIWTALPADGQPIGQNMEVTVQAVQGVKLMVLPLPTPPYPYQPNN
jgi:membrane protein implicated in regulation of membrane protease activity